MKLCVVGLGLIGGSVCLSLRRARILADGSDADYNTLQYALSHGIIEKKADDFAEYDFVIVALPPEATERFLLTAPVKEGAIVADICGVKEPLERAVLKTGRSFRYLGTHPMAGKENSGIGNACDNLFDGASIVITENERTDAEAKNQMLALAKRMGFARAVLCSAKVHDEKIAYTSQLAHVVSNAYVKDDEIDGCFGFTGGSFQDMTRIAGVDEKMWAALYLKNAENLQGKVGRLRDSLDGFLKALGKAREQKDESILSDFLREGAEIFRAGRDCDFAGEAIKVLDLTK